jgi:UDP-N-acetylmuramate--alanine ligase
MIFEDVTAASKMLITKEKLMDVLKDKQLDVLATFGAGNIDRFVEPITRLLDAR